MLLTEVSVNLRIALESSICLSWVAHFCFSVYKTFKCPAEVHTVYHLLLRSGRSWGLGVVHVPGWWMKGERGPEVQLVYVVLEELCWKGAGPPMCWPSSFDPPCSSAHGREYTQTSAQTHTHWHQASSSSQGRMKTSCNHSEHLNSTDTWVYAHEVYD